MKTHRNLIPHSVSTHHPRAQPPKQTAAPRVFVLGRVRNALTWLSLISLCHGRVRPALIVACILVTPQIHITTTEVRGGEAFNRDWKTPPSSGQACCVLSDAHWCVHTLVTNTSAFSKISLLYSLPSPPKTILLNFITEQIVLAHCVGRSGLG